MKIVLFFFVSFLSLVPVMGQFYSLKKGAYRNMTEFNNQTPYCTEDFVFIKEKSYHIPELYSVIAVDKKIKNSYINKKIWCICDSDNFYLNANRIGMDKGFIKIDTFRFYSYFKGATVKSINQQARIKHSAINFGVTGLLVSGVNISIENKGKNQYVINKLTGNVNLLSKKYILMHLQPYSDLLYNFNQERDNESIETLIKYLNLINNKIELNNGSANKRN